MPSAIQGTLRHSPRKLDQRNRIEAERYRSQESDIRTRSRAPGVYLFLRRVTIDLEHKTANGGYHSFRLITRRFRNVIFFTVNEFPENVTVPRRSKWSSIFLRLRLSRPLLMSDSYQTSCRRGEE
jgi:hypothetical protein